MGKPIESAGLRGAAAEVRIPKMLARVADVAPKMSYADRRPGKPRHKAPDGHLYCTRGKHVRPISEFPTSKTVKGLIRLCSWCCECKRKYDRDSQRRSRQRAMEKRHAEDRQGTH